MKSALVMIAAKFPHIITSTCAAHAASNLMNDIFKIQKYSGLLESAKQIARYFKTHIIPSNEFRNLEYNLRMANIPTGGMLKCPTPTRWGSAYDCLLSVYQNKHVLETLIQQQSMDIVSGDSDYILIRQMISDDTLWNNLKQAIESIKDIRLLISLMESDRSDLSMVVEQFSLVSTYSDSPKIKELVSARLGTCISDHTFAAFLIHPQRDANVLDHRGKASAMKIFNSCTNNNEEVTRYINNRGNLTQDEKDILQNNGLETWWRIFGASAYPTIAKLAIKLIGTACSSASAERVWSCYSFIHSNKRNRLLPEKIEKLALIYYNSMSTKTHILDDIEFCDPFPGIPTNN